MDPSTSTASDPCNADRTCKLKKEMKMTTAKRHRVEAELLQSIIRNPIAAHPRNTGTVRDAWKGIAESNGMEVAAARIMFRQIKNRYLVLKKREKKRPEYGKDWVHFKAMRQLDEIAEQRNFASQEKEQRQMFPSEEQRPKPQYEEPLPLSGPSVEQIIRQGSIEDALRAQNEVERAKNEVELAENRALRAEYEALNAENEALGAENETLRHQAEMMDMALAAVSKKLCELESNFKRFKSGVFNPTEISPAQRMSD